MIKKTGDGKGDKSENGVAGGKGAKEEKDIPNYSSTRVVVC